ncbi:quinone-dependent dihydroorotate dehydrogenase [Capilliphycus salinus ALCB114379]|uniref:quinone-dependent dihydroorotate dehydrogenase n=1 Tax=Capilliphycus salinus TaxID=2768948 RepID=UPI0039A5B9FD
MDIYRSGIRPVLFSGLNVDPEWAHHQTLQLLSWLDRTSVNPVSSWIESTIRSSFSGFDPRLTQTLWGLEFTNPIGLGAGFDKDGVAAGIWQSLGFGFAELGTVTFHPQPGNPQPRLFRLLSDQAVLNRMGFNNLGAKALATRLQSRETRRPISIPIGINLGKSKITPLEEAESDYLGSFRELKGCGDYFVVNVSSPNTPGLRSLQDSEQLSKILHSLQQENEGEKPLLVKIAPDLENEAICDIIELAGTYQLAGIIATNTTISREGLTTQKIAKTGKFVSEEAGGISGKPLQKRSTEVIRLIWQKTRGQLPIIGVGGIFTALDAWEKITAGASLVQVYTGWVYEGPGMIRNLSTGLLQKLEEQGLESISQAVGLANKTEELKPLN